MAKAPQPSMSNSRLNRGRLADLRVSDEQSIVDFISFWSDNRDVLMSGVERAAFRQIAWTMGRQYLGIEEATSTLVDESDFDHSPWWRVNAVENRLLPLVEGRLSKLLARMPVPVNQPATSDEEDEEIASLGSFVLRHYWRNILDMNQKLWEAHWWAETTGTAYLLTGWDPHAGPEIRVDSRLLNGGFGGGPTNGRSIEQEIFGSTSVGRAPKVQRAGDVFVDVRTVFDVLVDPAARCIEEAEWVLINRFRAIDQLVSRYKAKADKLEPGKHEPETQTQRRLAELISGNPGQSDFGLRDHVLVRELWVRSSMERPGGIHAVFAQDTLLQRQRNPYAHREVPVTAVYGVRAPISAYGTSKVAQLMETQDRLNDIRSTKTEYLRLNVYPKILDPTLSQIDDESFTTEMGERIRYQFPHRPEYLFPPPMPQYVAALENDAIQAFQDLGDIHEVSQAQTPGGLRSGRAILALQAQDEARFGQVIQLRDRSLQRVGRQILSLLHQFVTERRLIQIAGDDMDNEVHLFTQLPGFIGTQLVGRNADLAGVDYFRVTMETDSQLPLTPEGQRLVIDSLLERGVLRPDVHRDLILRMVGITSAEPVFQESRAHRSLAVRENRRMADGEHVLPAKWNNHDIHIATHTRFMNSGEFRRLDLPSQQLFDNHLTRHHHMRMMEAMRPQFLAALAQETVPQMLRAELQNVQQEAQTVGQPRQRSLEDLEADFENLVMGEEGEEEAAAAVT